MTSSSRGDEVFSSPRLIVITGGARAGKSQFAQKLGEQNGYLKRVFLATAVACDREMKDRIGRHRRSRNGLWTTLEEPADLPARIPKKLLQKGNLILLDCLPTFLTNLLLKGRSPQAIRRQVAQLIRVVHQPGLTVLVVTNEVGLGIVPENALSRQFRDLLGSVNQQVAKAADEVHLLVAGIPVRLK